MGSDNSALLGVSSAGQGIFELLKSELKDNTMGISAGPRPPRGIKDISDLKRRLGITKEDETPDLEAALKEAVQAGMSEEEIQAAAEAMRAFKAMSPPDNAPMAKRAVAQYQLTMTVLDTFLENDALDPLDGLLALGAARGLAKLLKLPTPDPDRERFKDVLEKRMLAKLQEMVTDLLNGEEDPADARRREIIANMDPAQRMAYDHLSPEKQEAYLALYEMAEEAT